VVIRPVVGDWWLTASQPPEFSKHWKMEIKTEIEVGKVEFYF